MEPPTLFDAQIPARATDPDTSKAAAKLGHSKRQSARYSLALAYALNGPLTDEEAARLAGLGQGAWKRCSELRASGMIDDTGERRVGSAGAEVMVCRMPLEVASAFLEARREAWS